MGYFKLALRLLLLIQYVSAIDLTSRHLRCFTQPTCSRASAVFGPHGNTYSTAVSCCTNLGGKFVQPEPIGDASFQCIQCLTVGFTVPSLVISGNGTIHQFEVKGTAGIPSTISSLMLQLSIQSSSTTTSRSLSTLLDLVNYPLSLSTPFQLSSTTSSRQFSIKLRQYENRIGLQDNANYTLRLTAVSTPRDSVLLYTNRDLLLSITDPDIVYVGFVKSSYIFSESDGANAAVTVSLSIQIAQSIKLRISGGPSQQPSTVISSGSTLNQIIEFQPNGPLTQTVPLRLTDDSIAMEDLEVYVVSLSLIGVSASDERIVLGGANLHDRTIISVTDNDVCTISMAQSTVQVNETSSLVSICAVLSTATVRPVSITFTTSPLTANDPSDYIGGIQRKTVQPSQRRVCSSYSIIQDNEREGEETFMVTISALSPSDNTGVRLGDQLSTTVSIIDSSIETVEPSCIKDIDVLFILDSSGSIGENNYTTMINFVSVVAEHFEFGPDKAQFGVVTFSTTVSLDVPLSSHDNPTAFKNDIMSIPYKARTTDTAGAIRTARNELVANGRPGTPRVIILFTDGRSNVPVDTLREARLSKLAGIRFLTIGIGPRIDLTELNGIASDSDSVFLIESFSMKDFVSILAPIVRETCEVLIGFSRSSYQVSEDGSFIDVSFQLLNGTLNRNIMVQFTFSSGTATINSDFRGQARTYTLTPSQTQATARFTIIDDTLPEREEFFTASISTNDEFVKVSVPTTRIHITDDDDKLCQGNIDLIVVLDSSGSILPDEFERVKRFVSRFTSEFKIGSEAHIGVITFSNTAHVDIQLGQMLTSTQFQQAVSQIPFRPGLTNTASAINTAIQQFTQNGRSNTPRALLIITDGQSNNKDSTLQASANARAQGIEVFATGVGDSVDRDELNGIASDPDDRHVSLLDDFSQTSLSSLLKPLTKSVCEPSCQREIDFMLLIDSSLSSSLNNFNQLQQFLVKLTQRYQISSSATRFGIISLSTSASLELPLASSLSSIQRAIRGINYAPLGTSISTGQGIELALQQFTLNGRLQIPQVIMILIGSSISDLQVTQRIAKLSDERGVEIFAVSIGDGAIKSQLESVVTQPSGNHIFNVLTVTEQSFNGISSDVVRSTCSVPPCRTPPLDIILALDGSSSVGSNNFRNLLNFVVDLTSQYNIDRTSGTQIGIVTFASTAQRTISLSQFQSKEALSNAIISIPYTGSGTSTHLALREVREEFQANGRTNARHVLIVATDGQSNNPQATITESNLAKDGNIEIFSIGIGSGANRDELNAIATDGSHVSVISNYTAVSFSGILQSLTKGICTKPLVCTHQSEIIFVIDSTISIESFESIKQYIIEIVSQITIDQTSGTRIAIIQYNSRPRLVIRLKDHTNIQTLINSIVLLQQDAQSNIRNTGSAIELAYNELRTDGRVGVGQIVYVITGGPSTNLDSTLEAVSRRDGITLVALGPASIRRELLSIASFSRFALSLDNFKISSLRRTSELTVQLLCTQKPHCQLNMLFVLDSSSPLTSSNFNRLNQFIIDITNQYKISSSSSSNDGSQFGIITYGSTIGGIKLGDITNRNSLIQAIQNRRQSTSFGRRDLHIGLRNALSQLTSLASSFRSNVIVVMMTGLSANQGATLEAIRDLKSLEDTEIFVISITDVIIDEAFLSELIQIGTKPRNDHVFNLRNFRSLNNQLLSLLIKEFCDDDSNVKADPMFTVPLYGLPSSPSLCYEVYGEANKYFNILSEKCLSVNAHYSSLPASHKITWRPLHVIDKFGIRISSGKGHSCFDVLIELKGRHCLVTSNGTTLTKGHHRVKGDIDIMVARNHVSLSLPNCELGKIVFKIKSKPLPTYHEGSIKAFLEFGIEGGSGITPSAHGLVGQFWNASVKIDRKDIKLRFSEKDNLDIAQIYALNILNHNNNGSTVERRVPALLQDHTWGVGSNGATQCLYAGDSQGGSMYEILEPNDSLLEGSYKDYIVSDLFSVDYKYSQFKEKQC